MKSVIVTLLSLISLTVAIGQPIYFNNRYDFGEFSETGPNIIEIPGGYIVAGEGVDGTWSYYYEIVKIDKNGNEIWKKKYGEVGFTYSGGVGGSLNQTYDNNFVDAGIFIDTSGKYSALLIKFDNNGDTLWSKKYTGGNVGYGAYQCKQTIDSGIIIIGASDKNDLDGDILLIKTDSIGNLEWEKTYGGGGIEQGFTIELTKDGGYILGGYTNSFGAGDYDAYVVKTDIAGNEQWSKTYGGIYSDGGASILPLQDGYVVSMMLTLYKDGPNDKMRQFWLMKTDNNGNIIWDKKMGPVSSNLGMGIQQLLSDSGLIVRGDVHDSINDSRVGVLLRINKNGDSLWMREYKLLDGPDSQHYFRDVKATSDGGFIVAGFIQPVFPDTGTQDMWVIKLDSCGCAYLGCDSACQGLLSINEKYKIINEKLKIKPNPTTGKFILEMLSGAKEVKPLEIRIYDILGTEIKQIKVKSKKIYVDISEYGAGIYFIQVKNETDSYSSRVVKY